MGNKVKIRLFCEEENVIEIGNLVISPEGVTHLFLELRGGKPPIFHATNNSDKYETEEKQEIRAQIRELIERLKE